jgi:hypothetical protein
LPRQHALREYVRACSPSAILGILLFICNAFFLWDSREKYKTLS